MAEALNNPLLRLGRMAEFGEILPEHVRPAIEAELKRQNTELERLENEKHPNIQWLRELEGISERIHRVWNPVAHLNAVVSTPELRAAYNDCLPLVTGFHAELSQNDRLFELFSAVESNSPDLDATVKQLIALSLRDFRLAGVALCEDDKRRFKELMLELADKQASFEQNLMDATKAFEYRETDRERLAGLPELVVEAAAQLAIDNDEDGFLFRLDPPTYQAIVTHADSEALRERFYRAWVTRASDQDESGKWNNDELIDDILVLRDRAAKLLGFPNYAEYSLASKMASCADEVARFLRDLASRSKPQAEAELDELERIAERPLKAWDIAYYAEKLRQRRFDLSEEALRPFFPLPRVLEGLFELARRLFGIVVSQATEGVSVWHPSVEYFELRSERGVSLGGLYADFFARPDKRGGAWMDAYINRAKLHDESERPVAHLVCNFGSPLGETPSLLTHNDVVTLFHEFGHCLHHLLTEIDYPSIAGINGVAWDAVELPSQFFENYAWLPEVLADIARHYRNGERLADEKIDMLNRSRRFLSGLAMLRQVEFALFDLEVHRAESPPRGEEVLDLLNGVRGDVAVVEQPEYNRFANSFAHIFAGSYAAGYYSYKWAEVLSADAFSAFEEAGALDRHTADRFRSTILAVGGSRDALQAFTDFRGRAPRLEPLLAHCGIKHRGDEFN